MTASSGDGVALARSIARTSRPTGSVAEGRARAECVDFLTTRGFQVVEQSFDFSTHPGRWSTAMCGLVLAVAYGIAAGMTAGGTTSVTRGVGIAAAFTVAVAAFGWWTARWGTRLHRSGRARGVNLVGRRGIPNIWLVAHLDTKGQPVSLFVRAGAVIVIVLGWLVTLGGWIVLALVGGDVRTIVVGGLILACLGALPLTACLVTDRGTGALDNASGVATIFEAVDRLPRGFPIGVLVTTAEELALAGARAWAAGRPPGVAINCDGVDDEGEIVCIMSRDPSGRLMHAVETSRARLGVRVGVRRMLPGVLFDSVALAQGGWETMTVARGTLRSLARVHTANDTLAAWSGSGVADTAAFVAAVAGAIVGRDVGDHPAGREEQQWSRT